MFVLVKSVLNSTDENKFLVMQNIMEEIKSLLNPIELKVFQYLYDSYKTYNQFPTESVFLNQFPEYKISLSGV